MEQASLSNESICQYWHNQEMTLTKHNIRGMVRVKTYPLMSEAVEIGTDRGWRRAHKHKDDPSQFDICTAIEQAIMEEICERFDFELDDVQEQQDDDQTEAF